MLKTIILIYINIETPNKNHLKRINYLKISSNK